MRLLGNASCRSSKASRWKYSGRGLAIVLSILAAGGAVFAYNSGARNSLLRSRDQVADQKYQLERAYNDVDRKIAELQQQKWTISRYLSDCDRSLKEIDRALIAQDQAYRDAR